jgi:ribosomal protein S18 acetylase RimI-like enzyme
VKSVWEHGSVGIDDDGIVADARAAARLLAERAAARGGEWFAEGFVEGRELNVALLAGPGGPEVLPIGEIRFQDWPAGKPRIVNYAAKWQADSFEYGHTPRAFDLPPEDAPLLAELGRLALACWRLFDLRGHARVDFRVDGAGRPWVLEVNANPCISPESGFVAMLEEAGIGYDQAIARIVADALSAGDAGPVGAAAAGRRGRAARRAAAGPSRAAPAFRDGVRPADRDAVRELVAATGFFSQDEVAIAVELVDERLARGSASGYAFVLAEQGGRLAGYTCYGPVAGTASSWDLYWIVVAPDAQGRGLGRRLLTATEERVRAAGGRRLYADTSGRAQYAPTRAFYRATGFAQAAYLPEFYGPGDAKVIFCKEVTAG